MDTTTTTVIMKKLVDLYSSLPSLSQNVDRFESKQLSMSLSRQKNWIKWVMPLKYEGQELVEFAVCKHSHLTKEENLTIVKFDWSAASQEDQLISLKKIKVPYTKRIFI